MPIHNADVAEVFSEIADLLEIQGANPFRGDAHSVAELDNVRYGVNQARRGWLERADVLNTRSLARLRPLLARTMRLSAHEIPESR